MTEFEYIKELLLLAFSLFLLFLLFLAFQMQDEEKKGGDDSNLSKILGFANSVNLKVRLFFNKNYLIDLRERKSVCLGFLFSQQLLADVENLSDGKQVINQFLHKYYDDEFVGLVLEKVNHLLEKGPVEINVYTNPHIINLCKLYNYAERCLLAELLYEVGSIGGLNKREWFLLPVFATGLGLLPDDREKLHSAYYSNRVNENDEKAREQKAKKDDSAGKQKAMYFQSNYENRQCLSTLGLDEYATIEDVKKAYRAFAKTYHPDAVQDEGLKKRNTERFKEFHSAYEKLMSSVSERPK